MPLSGWQGSGRRYSGHPRTVVWRLPRPGRNAIGSSSNSSSSSTPNLPSLSSSSSSSLSSSTRTQQIHEAKVGEAGGGGGDGRGGKRLPQHDYEDAATATTISNLKAQLAAAHKAAAQKDAACAKKLAAAQKTIAQKDAVCAEKDAELAALRLKVAGGASNEYAPSDAAIAAAASAAADAADHLAKLPHALQTFKIVADFPAVAALTSGANDAKREALEKAVEAAAAAETDPVAAASSHDSPQKAAAVADLSAYVAELEAATKQAIEAYLKEEGLFKRAFEALEAGNSTFLAVYSAVWDLVKMTEPSQLAVYKKRVVAAAAKLPEAKQQQAASTVAELFRDAAKVKPKFAVVVRDKLYKQLKLKRKEAMADSKLKICPTLKKTTRLAEKAAFAGTAAGISDVVRGMIVVKSMAGVDAVLEMLLELEAEGVIKIVRLKDRFCTVPSTGGWRDLMVNMTIVGDATNHICELQVVHEHMMTAREGLPGHAVYDRVRNAVELLGKKFGGEGPAGDALALAGVLVGMGGGDAVGKEGFVESRDSHREYEGEAYTDHHGHISGKDVFLADKGWLSDALLKEWLGVRVDERTSRVTHVELKGKGLVGSIPRLLAELTELEHLDLRDNEKMTRPIGMTKSDAYPTGELGLLDMTGQVHYTSKERCQQFCEHLKLSEEEQQATVADVLLVAKHGPEGPALRKFFDANNKYPGWEAKAGKQRWFQEEVDVSKWHGVIGQGVVGLKLEGFGFTDRFKVDGLAEMNHLRVLNLEYCSKLTSLPDSLGQLTNLEELNLEYCTELTSLPESLGQLTNLKVLNIGKNYAPMKLTSLPESLGQLTNLKKLNLRYCTELASLPNSFGQLINLEQLNLSGCTKWTSLPNSFGQLANLEKLDLSGCTKWTSLPDSLGQLTNLKGLYLSSCTKLASLPDSLGQLANLKGLNLRGCSKLASLPDSLGQLTNLEELNLRECKELASLPDSLGQLTNLEELNLRFCYELTSLPESLGQLTNLEELNLCGCTKLASLPDLSHLPPALTIKTYRTSAAVNAWVESGYKALNMLTGVGYPATDINFEGYTGASLPEWVYTRTNLKELHLSNCKELTSLPDSLGQLTNLKELNLSSCKELTSLPDLSHLLPALKVGTTGETSAAAKTWVESGCKALDMLTGVGYSAYATEISFAGYTGASLPDWVCTRTNLKVLNLKCCSKLTLLPDSLGQLTNLEELDLRFCYELTSLPESLGQLTNLKGLHLRDCNELASLPDSLGQLTNLKVLNLEYCPKLTSLPDSLGQLTNLKDLNLYNCPKLTSLPDSLGQLTNLKELNLSHCSGLTSLPDSLGQLANLEKLNLTCCSKLTSLPNSFGQLINLEQLDLRFCTELTSLPESLALTNLKVLNMDGESWAPMKLTSLPESLGQLTNLKELNLTRCSGLTSLPDSLGQLANLEKLNLTCCSKLTSLPDSLGQLTDLKELDLCGCRKLASLPDSLGQLTNLEKLNLHWCKELASLPDLSHLLPALKIDTWELKAWVKAGCKAT